MQLGALTNLSIFDLLKGPLGVVLLTLTELYRQRKDVWVFVSCCCRIEGAMLAAVEVDS